MASMSFVVVFLAHQKETIISGNNMSEVNVTKNHNARSLKISENAPQYPNCMLLKFQLDRSISYITFIVFFYCGIFDIQKI